MEGYGKYDLSISAALTRVQEEVRRMGGTGLRVDTDLRVRNDGLPYSKQAAPEDPGVVVAFRLSGNKAVVFPCDRYSKVEQNLAAIAATLEAKRAIERHGVSTVEREFEGYAALPASIPLPGKRPAWDVLGVSPDAPPNVIEAAFKALALERHPDRGGTNAAFVELSDARMTMLGLNGGIKA